MTTPDALLAPALAGDPFLHCCTPGQLDFVLARHFAGRSGLIVLSFDSEAVDGEVKWVRSEPDQDPFPHLHGALRVALGRAIPAPDPWGVSLR